NGLQFWVTRDAEDGSESPPVAPATGTWTASSNLTVSAVGRFPAPPHRAAPLVDHQFRVNSSTRPGHTFSVRMNDGYRDIFDGTQHTDLATGVQIPPYSLEQIDNWWDNGQPDPLPIYTFTAKIDPTCITTLWDESINPAFSMA